MSKNDDGNKASSQPILQTLLILARRDHQPSGAVDARLKNMRHLVAIALIASLLSSCDTSGGTKSPTRGSDLIVLAEVHLSDSRIEYYFDRVIFKRETVRVPYGKGDLVGSGESPKPDTDYGTQIIIFLERKSDGRFSPFEMQAVHNGRIPAVGLTLSEFEEHLQTP